MGAVFSKPKPPPPPPPPPPAPTAEDPSIEEARRKEIMLARKSRGTASTLLTGCSGVTNSAPTERKTLLGA